MSATIPAAIPAALTITAAYEDAGEFSNLLDKLSFAQREINMLTNEGFTSLSAIVLNFSSSNDLHKELIQSNKTFATATLLQFIITFLGIHLFLVQFLILE